MFRICGQIRKFVENIQICGQIRNCQSWNDINGIGCINGTSGDVVGRLMVRRVNFDIMPCPPVVECCR
jgi:hypothetical protein